MGKMVKIEPILGKFMTLTHGEILTTLAIESGFVCQGPLYSPTPGPPYSPPHPAGSVTWQQYSL